MLGHVWCSVDGACQQMARQGSRAVLEQWVIQDHVARVLMTNCSTAMIAASAVGPLVGHDVNVTNVAVMEVAFTHSRASRWRYFSELYL
jgi:hypothetical protein